MKRVISISRIIDSHEVARGTREVIASAETVFDEAKSELVVDLDSKAMITDAHGHETLVTEDWLPPRQTIREHMPFADAPDAAREIFECWAGKVRDGIPGLVVR